MDFRKQPTEDDGVTHIQRLDPNRVDVVLGSHPRRKPARQGKGPLPVGLVIVCLAFAGLVYWLGSTLTRPAPAATPITLARPVQPLPVAASVPASEPVPAPSAPPAVQQVAFTASQPVAQESPPVSAQPLDNCIKHGNVIDESVLNCRFGETPRPAPAPASQGMVSDRYLAEFKSGASRKEEPRRRLYTQVSMTIREWDGSDRYRAQWRQYDNRIDQDSVCENFTRASVERRECRKAAQVHFKELCREWTRRAARDRDEKSVDARERYCEVASSFTP